MLQMKVTWLVTNGNKVIKKTIQLRVSFLVFLATADAALRLSNLKNCHLLLSLSGGGRQSYCVSPCGNTIPVPLTIKTKMSTLQVRLPKSSISSSQKTRNETLSFRVSYLAHPVIIVVFYHLTSVCDNSRDLSLKHLILTTKL